FLGRERYARAETSPQAREGSRNGYGETTIKTTSGPVTLSRPKLRGTTEAFASRLLGTGVTKTHALESLVIAGFVRGLSTRDVEAHPRGPAGLCRAGHLHRGVHRRLVGVPARPGRPRSALSTVGDLRRRRRADQCGGADHARRAAPEMSDSPGPQPRGEDPEERPGRGQGRLLGHLRGPRAHRARARGRRLRAGQHRRVRHALARRLP